MISNRTAVVVCVAAAVAGCAAFPSVVVMPKVHNAPGQTYDMSSLADHAGVFPVEVSPSQVMAQAALYAATWRKASTDLLVQRDVANNAQFGATIAGAYNTAKNSLRAAKWWLAGAAGIALIEDRYQIEAQALQYANGASAMDCVRTEIAALPPSIWSEYDPLGNFTGDVPPSASPNGDAEAANYQLRRLFADINQRMGTIADRVRVNVSAKKLTVPTAEDIAQAVNRQQAAQARAGTMAQAFVQQRSAAVRAGLGGNNPLPDGVYAAALALPTKLDNTCVTGVPK